MNKILGSVLGALLLVGCGQSGPSPLGALSGPLSAQSADALTGAVSRADQARFAQLDTNHDGRLSLAETGLPESTFAGLDQNRDGGLSLAELTPDTGFESERAQIASQLSEGQAQLLGFPLDQALTLNTAPSQGQGTPVVFVPGYLDFEVYFTVLKHDLAAQGRPTSYLEIFPNVGDINVAAAALKKQVEAVRAQTGAAKVDLVAHSMGGLIAMTYLKDLGGSAEVAHLVSLASPYHGTIAAHFSPTKGAVEMRPGSPFLKALMAGSETPAGVKVTSIRGGMDELIIPHSSPILQGADNELVPSAMHGTIFLESATRKYMDAGLAH
ncbi:MAG TPA: alpha/beta fold hydrolase [Oscillatoriaceae cyanobacterium]